MRGTKRDLPGWALLPGVALHFDKRWVAAAVGCCIRLTKEAVCTRPVCHWWSSVCTEPHARIKDAMDLDEAGPVAISAMEGTLKAYAYSRYVLWIGGFMSSEKLCSQGFQNSCVVA